MTTRMRARITEAALGIAESDVDEIMVVIKEEVAPLLEEILKRKPYRRMELYRLATSLRHSVEMKL